MTRNYLWAVALAPIVVAVWVTVFSLIVFAVAGIVIGWIALLDIAGIINADWLMNGS